MAEPAAVRTGAPLPDPVDEGRRLVDAAGARGLTMRLLGGVAVCIQSPGGAPLLPRDIHDVDIAVRRGYRNQVTELAKEMGYAPDQMFNALHGSRRLLFYDEANQRKLDVFIGEFSMCHSIPITDRLARDPLTIPLAELLLTKLQIVELNAKDAHDIFHLLSGLRVGQDSARPAIDPGRFGEVLAADWGWWRTVTGNLAKLPDLLSAQPGLAPPSPRVDALTQAKQLLEVAETVPKGLKWKTRSRVGDRVRWYELPEEVRR